MKIKNKTKNIISKNMLRGYIHLIIFQEKKFTLNFTMLQNVALFEWRGEKAEKKHGWIQSRKFTKMKYSFSV